MSLIFSSDDADFAAYYAESEPAAKVHSASTWAEQLAALHDNPRAIRGARLPWSRTHFMRLSTIMCWIFKLRAQYRMTA